jgi:hypothetical protein
MIPMQMLNCCLILTSKQHPHPFAGVCQVGCAGQPIVHSTGDDCVSTPVPTAYPSALDPAVLTGAWRRPGVSFIGGLP